VWEPPVREPRSGERAESAVVLMAEDDEIYRTVAAALLARRGLVVEIANDGLQAAEMAAHKTYDAILMDCQMPELDGFEAARCIRAAEIDRRVPIIAITAYPEEGKRERCLDAGMDDYLSKPVRIDEFDVLLQRWLTDLSCR
jgi:two-component system, sensor histidine kinase and response regulator